MKHQRNRFIKAKFFKKNPPRLSDPSAPWVLTVDDELQRQLAEGVMAAQHRVRADLDRPHHVAVVVLDDYGDREAVAGVRLRRVVELA